MNTVQPQRACNKCKVVKPITLENYQAISNSSDGFRKTCKPCKAEKDKARYLVNRKQTINRAITWYAENKDKKQNYDKEYRIKHREQKQASNRKSYAKTRQQIPQKYKAKIYSAKSKRFDKTHRFIAKDFTRMLERQRYRCFYCEARFTNLLDMEVEHVLAATRGGRNTKGNVVLACRVCNRSKATKTVMEFRLEKVILDPGNFKKSQLRARL